MADKIKKSDLFEDGLFDDAVKGAERLAKNIKDLQEGMVALMTATKNKVQVINPTESKDIQAINKEVQNTVQLITQKEKLDQQALKTAKDLETLRQSQLKTLQQKEVLSQKELATERAIAKAYAEEERAAKKANAERIKTEAISKKLSSTFEQNRKKLKELTSQLLDLKPGTAEFNKLAAEAGKIKDEMNDAKDAVKAFANESKTATAKTLFSQIGSDIANLDFKGAADKAKIFAQVVGQISFKEVIGGIQNFGSALAGVGKALLENTFGLALAAVTALAGGMYYLITASNQQKKAFDDTIKSIDEYAKSTEDARKEVDKLLISLAEQRGKISEFDADRKNLLIENAKELKALNAAFKAEEAKIRDEDDENFIENDFKRNEALLYLKERFDEKWETTVRQQNLKLKLLSEDASFKEADALSARFDKLAEIAEKKAKEAEDKRNERDKKRKEFEKKRSSDIFNADLEAEQMAEAWRIQNEEDSITRQREEFEEKKKINDAFIQYELDAITGKYGEAEQLIAQQSLETKIALGTASPAELEVWYAQQRKKKEDADKKAADNAKEVQKVTLDALEKGLQKQADKRQQFLDKEIAQRNQNIDRQRELAAKGIANTLAFEEAQKAKAELAKEQEAKREAKRQKAIAFLKLLSSYAEKDGATAVQKAVRDIALASLFENSFATGVEGLKGDGTETSDSILARLSKNESVITAKGTKENAGLPTAMNEGKVDEYFTNKYLPRVAMEAGINSGTASNMASSLMLQQLVGVNNRLQGLEKAIMNKRETHTNIDNVGNVITADIENGFKKVVTKMRKRPQI